MCKTSILTYLAASSTAAAVAGTVQDSSDIPATASAAATVLPASVVLTTCSSPQHCQPTSRSTANFQVKLFNIYHRQCGSAALL